MRKKEIKNKNLMSALMIGISAMMTLSTPVTAYASSPTEGDNNEPEPAQPQTEQVTAQETVVTAPVTEEAQQQAEVVQEAAAVAEDSAVNEATEAAQAILEGKAEAGIAAVVEGEAGTITDQAIEELTEAAKDVVEDTKDEEGNVTEESAVTSLGAASEAMDEIKDNLKAADSANHEADVAQSEIEEYGERALENGTQAVTTSQDMVKDTEDAQKKADILVEAINNAANQDEAEKAYKELEKNVADTNTSLADKKAYYDRLMENYEKAKAELKRAEEALEVFEHAYNRNVDEALEKAEAAEEDIEAAQAKVDNLAKALDHVEDNLLTEAQEAKKTVDAFDKVTTHNWDLQRDMMKDTIVNYVIPQLEGEKITDVKWDRVGGFDSQNYNYCILTYKDSNGKTQTRYFNFDRISRTNGEDRYADSTLGKAWGIAVYEKTADEIAANDFLVDLYGKEKYTGKDLHEKANGGAFDVFAYKDDTGKNVFMTREMLENAIASGDIIDDNGVMKTKDGRDVKEIVQNSNSVINGGNAYIFAKEADVTGKYKNTILNGLKANHTAKEAEAIYNKMVEDNKAYNAYLTAARAMVDENGEAEHILARKYASYQEAVDEAQDAVDKAKDEAAKLNDAIGDLKEVKKSRYVLAVAALKVDDIATYFGMDVTPERAAELNKMTVQQALVVLEEHMKEANTNLDLAKANYQGLVQEFEEAKADLEAVRDKFRPIGNQGGGGTGGASADAGTVADGAGARRDAAVTPAAPAAVAAAEAQAPAGGGDAAARTAATQTAATQTATIQDEAAAQAEAPDAGAGNVEGAGAGGAGAEEAVAEGAEIVDEAIALAQAPEMEEKIEDATAIIEDGNVALAEKAQTAKKMSWWWALILLILGERGRELYVKYKKDAESENEIKD